MRGKNLFTITSSLDLVFGPAQFWLAFSIGMSNFLSTWPFIPLSLVVSGSLCISCLNAGYHLPILSAMHTWSMQHNLLPSRSQHLQNIWFLSHSYCHPFFFSLFSVHPEFPECTKLYLFRTRWI